MAQPHVLRLKRTDFSDQYLLVHVESNGSKPLDLKLIGTEHEHLYHAVLEESKVKGLQSASFTGSLAEWKAVLQAALVPQLATGDASETDRNEVVQGLETVAAIKKSVLTITFRKNIGGIIQRLGAIELTQDDEREAVSPFDWVDIAVSRSDELRAQLTTLSESVATQKEEVAKLTAQLDDLVTAKKEHEDELLAKFATLLNAKKLKIRDQMRLLQGAKINTQAALDVSSARGSRQNTGATRKGKRKIDESPEDDGDDDGGKVEGSPPEETPPPSDDEATEDEDDNGGSPAHSAAREARKGSNEQNTSKGDPSVSMDIDDPDDLPPKRELPFGKRTLRNAEPTAAESNENEDEDTDDEL